MALVLTLAARNVVELVDSLITSAPFSGLVHILVSGSPPSRTKWMSSHSFELDPDTEICPSRAGLDGRAGTGPLYKHPVALSLLPVPDVFPEDVDPVVHLTPACCAKRLGREHVDARAPVVPADFTVHLNLV